LKYLYMIYHDTIQFLKDLKQNNNREWFDHNRRRYEFARNNFIEFVQSLIDELSKFDSSIQLVRPKDCIFRIYRDVRFSADKSPYKTNFGAFITKSGKKAMNIAGYYFHLEPNNSFAGGGIYMPMPPELKKIRYYIDLNFPDFLEILNSEGFAKIFGGLDNDPEFLLNRLPKGYDGDNPAIEYLKFKSFTASKSLSDSELTNQNLLVRTIEIFRTLKPFNDFLNSALL